MTKASELMFDEATHTYTYGGVAVPSVTKILGAIIRDREFERLMESRPEIIAAAADRGTRVHAYCEFFDNGVLDESSAEFDEEVRPYLEGWKQFCADSKFSSIHNEERLFHSKLMYAGTMDRMGEVNGELSIVDIKTSAVLKPAIGLQLVAYGMALKHCFPEYEDVKFKRYAVQLKKDGGYRLQKYDDETDATAFVSALNTYNWMKKHGYPLS